jgi:hypothetical protein
LIYKVNKKQVYLKQNKNFSLFFKAHEICKERKLLEKILASYLIFMLLGLQVQACF